MTGRRADLRSNAREDGRYSKMGVVWCTGLCICVFVYLGISFYALSFSISLVRISLIGCIRVDILRAEFVIKSKKGEFGLGSSLRAKRTWPYFL